MSTALLRSREYVRGLLAAAAGFLAYIHQASGQMLSENIAGILMVLGSLDVLLRALTRGRYSLF